MLIFAKDIALRDHRHPREAVDREFKAYMEYQRKLYPYTIVRAGLDLAYKELDDILSYIENDYRKPEDSQRDEYPADIPAWYRGRFPWTAAFLEIVDAHALLVRLIKSMDSFRTFEVANNCHWMVLYDAVHNIVKVYNELLAEDPNKARDIRLSNNVPVEFDDFINNYWPHLEFMILSRPDYPHAPLMERNRQSEEDIKELIADGLNPLEALEQAAKTHGFSPGTLPLLRRDPPSPDWAELEPHSSGESPYAGLAQPWTEDEECQGWSRLDAAYFKSFRAFQKHCPTPS